MKLISFPRCQNQKNKVDVLMKISSWCKNQLMFKIFVIQSNVVIWLTTSCYATKYIEDTDQRKQLMPLLFTETSDQFNEETPIKSSK